jgi:phosphomannomutase/phosphoglucomutase
MMLDQGVASILPASIFRAYDIRGIAGEQLSTECVYAIGQVLGSLTLEAGEKHMTVGRDGRLSGPTLIKALSAGILSTGCDVIDVGVVPTPLLYYSTCMLGTQSGVMLTGSHNPAEYNGLKMVIGGETLSDEAIQTIYHRATHHLVRKGEGEWRETEIIDRYSAHVAQDVKLSRPLKVVVDCGNGVAGNIVPNLYRRMGCEVIELFCEVDGRFPNHHPDPSQIENLQDLIRTVKETGADIGVAFDGDADRLGVVTSRGEIIWPDRQLILFAKSILEHTPGAKIIYDVKCTSHLEKMIRQFGGEPIMWKTGHSLIKKKLAETQAAIAGEMSGHIFFKDRWYGFDDAIYAGARLLQILSETHLTSAELFSQIPDSVNTPELKIHVTDEEKFLLMNQIISQASFADAEMTTIDGLRVNFLDGWGLVRSSNTTPCLVLRFEAETQAALSRIQQLFRDYLLSIKPDLVLSF